MFRAEKNEETDLRATRSVKKLRSTFYVYGLLGFLLRRLEFTGLAISRGPVGGELHGCRSWELNKIVGCYGKGDIGGKTKVTRARRVWDGVEVPSTLRE